MRRWLRRLFRVLWLVFLLLAVAAWMSSYVSTVSLVLDRGDGPVTNYLAQGWYVQSAWGGLLFRRNWVIIRDDATRVPHSWSLHIYLSEPSGMSPVQRSKPHFLGFQFAGQPFTGPTLVDRTRWAILPYWFLVLIISTPPISWAFRHFRLIRRNKLGLCLACGYDLRASKERCPECGTPIPVEASSGGGKVLTGRMAKNQKP